MESLFLSIASYRDPELLPTIRDCLARARHPQRLVFGICWQHDQTESLAEFTGDPRFKIVDVPYQQARGPCWARHALQQLWDGEQYVLQFDSHHRFSQDWDAQCIAMLRQLQEQGHAKPLLTTYLPPYNPANERRLPAPWWMTFNGFRSEGALLFVPAVIPNWEGLTGPVPARFFSAHFAFTLGQWCHEVPYDPQYYFHGEEISLAVRSYTHGYDLFCPHRTIAWHEYIRPATAKHWKDDAAWTAKDRSSQLRNRKLFGMDGEPQDMDFGVYGFGSERTLADYERYAGIGFAKRAVQRYTVQNQPPPNPRNEEFMPRVEEYASFVEVAAGAAWNSAADVSVVDQEVGDRVVG